MYSAALSWLDAAGATFCDYFLPAPSLGGLLSDAKGVLSLAFMVLWVPLSPEPGA